MRATRSRPPDCCWRCGRLRRRAGRRRAAEGRRASAWRRRCPRRRDARRPRAPRLAVRHQGAGGRDAAHRLLRRRAEARARLRLRRLGCARASPASCPRSARAQGHHRHHLRRQQGGRRGARARHGALQARRRRVGGRRLGGLPRGRGARVRDARARRARPRCCSRRCARSSMPFRRTPRPRSAR